MAKKTILIIEDETLIVLGLRDALEFEGRPARNFAEAFAAH